MTYKNPEQIIRGCKEEIAKNNKALATMILSEAMKQAILNDNVRIEKIKAVAEQQIREEQGK